MIRNNIFLVFCDIKRQKRSKKKRGWQTFAEMETVSGDVPWNCWGHHLLLPSSFCTLWVRWSQTERESHHKASRVEEMKIGKRKREMSHGEGMDDNKIVIIKSRVNSESKKGRRNSIKWWWPEEVEFKKRDKWSLGQRSWIFPPSSDIIILSSPFLFHILPICVCEIFEVNKEDRTFPLNREWSVTGSYFWWCPNVMIVREGKRKSFECFLRIRSSCCW